MIISNEKRSTVLSKICHLPSEAFISSEEAAAYLGTSAGVMSNWRGQRRGPKYHGSGEFIRYKLCELEKFMSARAEEIKIA
jgi:hypothetical protein